MLQKKGRKGLWLIITALVSLLVTSGSVTAASLQTNTSTSGQETVPMYFVRPGTDTRSLSKGGVLPDGTTYGNCGAVSIDLAQNGIGFARVTLGVVSSAGVMASEQWSWNFYKKGFLGFYYSTGQGNSGTNFQQTVVWGREDTVTTSGSGSYKAVFSSLLVTLIDGRQCVGGQPEAVRDLL